MMKSNDSFEKQGTPQRLKGSKEIVGCKGSRDSGKLREGGIGGCAAAAKPKKSPKKISTQRKRPKVSTKESSKSENCSEEEPVVKNEKALKVRSLSIVTLAPMDEVSSMTNSYVVTRKLGEGGFGAVYQVRAKTKPKNVTTRVFALKTEGRGPKSPDRLKIEVAVLTALLGLESEKNRERFAMMVDRGQTKDFVFIIMTLVGPSLQIIRDNILHKEYSPSTAFKIALESLEAIKIMHTEIGYIHRDIKPANFTIGHCKNFTKIILIDFGISRRIFAKDNTLRPPRKEVKFLGTVRYASRKCHKNEDQGRQSDCESWFYMICDIYNQTVLPWRRVREKDLVLALKNDLRENEGNNKCLTEQLPKDYREIMLYIDKLEYEDTPDYQLLKSLIEGSAKKMNVDLKQKWDWEVYGPPPDQDCEVDD